MCREAGTHQPRKRTHSLTLESMKTWKECTISSSTHTHPGSHNRRHKLCGRQASFQAGLPGDLLLLRHLCVPLEGMLPADGADLHPLLRRASCGLPLGPGPAGLPLLAAKRHTRQQPGAHLPCCLPPLPRQLCCHGQMLLGKEATVGKGAM